MHPLAAPLLNTNPSSIRQGFGYIRFSKTRHENAIRALISSVLVVKGNIVVVPDNLFFLPPRENMDGGASMFPFWD